MEKNRVHLHLNYHWYNGEFLFNGSGLINSEVTECFCKSLHIYKSEKNITNDLTYTAGGGWGNIIGKC